MERGRLTSVCGSKIRPNSCERLKFGLSQLLGRILRLICLSGTGFPGSQHNLSQPHHHQVGINNHHQLPSRTRGGTRGEDGETRGRGDTSKSRAPKVRRDPFPFLFSFTNYHFQSCVGRGLNPPPYFVFDAIQHEWGGFNSPHLFSTRFNANGGVQSLPTRFSTPFDTAGVVSTPPHFFLTAFNATGVVSRPPHPFSTRTEWVQPHPLIFHVFRHEWGGFNPTPLVLDGFRHERGGLNPIPLVFHMFQREWGGFNPTPVFFYVFRHERDGFNPTLLVFHAFRHKWGGFNPTPLVFDAFGRTTRRVYPSSSYY